MASTSTPGSRATDEAPLLDVEAEHATRLVPIAAPDDPAGTVLAHALAPGYDSVTDIAVCDGDHFRGLVHLEDLLAAAPATPITDLMDADVPVVSPGADEEIAAWQLVQHGERSLPVADAEGRFIGLIPPARMLRVLVEHHERDLARLGGFLHDASQARLSSEERVSRRLWHRLPWLIGGLVGAMAAAELLGAFEAQLERTVALALFIPGIVYMADAVGTQTETLVVRGLSVGVSIRSVLRRELLTGLLVGIALAGLLLPYLLLTQDDAAVAATVALALLASCSIATLVAMALPSLLHHLGRDPAFGSGPLATVIQDLLSLLVYLGIATTLIG
jgi:magnesium transporter